VTRRISTVVAVLVALLASASATHAAPRLTQIDAIFPERAYVLTLPSRSPVDPSQVKVKENRGRVSGLTVVPAAAERGGVRPVVLAIDTSNSMRGRPIAGAMVAARALAAQRHPAQPLGVIVFNRETSVLLPVTTDASAIRQALAREPQLVEGTRVFDAANDAARLLRDIGASSGSIILLSDGADTASAATADEAAATARGAHAKIFAVGLRSRQFDKDALAGLAHATGGRAYVASSPAALAPIYAQLGSELANEYVVRYRSLAGPQERVRVEVRVPGVAGVARSGYVAPALPPIPAATFQRSRWEEVWQSNGVLIGVAALCAVLLAVALLALLRPHDRDVRARISEYVSLSRTGRLETEAARFTEKVFTGTERSLEHTRWWARFKEELAIAEIRLPAVQIVLWTVVFTVVAFWLLWSLAGPAATILALGVPYGVRTYLKTKLERRRRKFADQLPDNLQVLASALRAGHSLVGALSVVVDDAPEPSRTEFRRVVADEQLGVPLEDSLHEVGRRMDNRDLDQVALVAMLGRETGGNTAEVLDRVAETVRERFELRRLVRVLTAQGRMSRWVVSALPIGLVVFITIINPEYMQPLYDRTVGRALLVGAAVLMVAGSLLIKRIVNIKV